LRHPGTSWENLDWTHPARKEAIRTSVLLAGISGPIRRAGRDAGQGSSRSILAQKETRYAIPVSLGNVAAAGGIDDDTLAVEV
jgi:hypothetical protein